ncbi:YfeC-like transcriptional regulator [Nocardioides aurantiacus]|uniref:YfeC-like transcriptional regulator n=1 Tax=Nocardioides aurantiacus TaxID=86796 RepID=UPI00403FB26F
MFGDLVACGVLAVGSRPAYAAGVDDFVTPRQLAEELGLSDRTIRQWLREQGWQGVPFTRWRLTEVQAAQVRSHFRRLG